EMCKTISKLVRTVIHEYRHFLQFKTYDNFLDYSTVSEKFSYEKNPYEMDCLSFEDLNFKSCYNVVIRKYKKSIYGFNI
ncbi:hypothetical protein EBU94_03645, partial [bacterium]|nr:hypothetical protein [bacterium]